MKIDCVKNTILKRCKLHKHTTHTKIILASFLFLVVFFIRDLVCLRSRWWYFFCFFHLQFVLFYCDCYRCYLNSSSSYHSLLALIFFCLVFVVTAMLCCCWTHLLRFFPVCYVRLIIFDSRQMQKKPRHIHTHSEATSA